MCAFSLFATLKYRNALTLASNELTFYLIKLSSQLTNCIVSTTYKQMLISIH